MCPSAAQHYCTHRVATRSQLLDSQGKVLSHFVRPGVETSAMGVIVLNIEDRRYGVILAEDESEPLLLTGVVYPCPQQKDSSKNIPAYFYSSYDVSDVA